MDLFKCLINYDEVQKQLLEKKLNVLSYNKCKEHFNKRFNDIINSTFYKMQ